MLYLYTIMNRMIKTAFSMKRTLFRRLGDSCLIPLDPIACESAFYGTNPAAMSESNIRKMPANSVLHVGSPTPSNEGLVHVISFDLVVFEAVIRAGTFKSQSIPSVRIKATTKFFTDHQDDKFFI